MSSLEPETTFSEKNPVHSTDVRDAESVAPSEELDVGAAYASKLQGSPYTRKEEVSLRWRLDRRILAISFFNVILASVDKTSTSTGALYGLKTDNHLTGDRYSWIGSSFYFGYLIALLPAAWAMQRFPLGKVIVGCQLVWGILLLAQGFLSSWPGLLTMRIILGILEAPVIPGAVIMLGMWYPRRDLALRLGFFYTGLAQLITGPIGYGVGFIKGTWFNPWRCFFWILGGITIIWALITGLLLPDSPVRAKFLSEREKAIAIGRMRVDQTGIENKHWKWYQVREVLLDPKTWLLFFFNIWIFIPNGGLTNFTPLIVKGMGYSPQRAALLTMPTGIIETLSAVMCNGTVFLVMTRYNSRLQIRGIVIILGLLVGMIAAVLLYTLPLDSYHLRLGALYVSYFYLGPYVISLGFITQNTGGHTKKVVLNAICFVANCVSNIIGPQFFKANQAPLYPLGMGAILVSYVLSIFTILLYMAYCWNENRKRDRAASASSAAAAAGPADDESENTQLDTSLKDLTDMQNLHVRYVW